MVTAIKVVTTLTITSYMTLCPIILYQCHNNNIMQPDECSNPLTLLKLVATCIVTISTTVLITFVGMNTKIPHQEILGLLITSLVAPVRVRIIESYKFGTDIGESGKWFCKY